MSGRSTWGPPRVTPMARVPAAACVSVRPCPRTLGHNVYVDDVLVQHFPRGEYSAHDASGFARRLRENDV